MFDRGPIKSSAKLVAQAAPGMPVDRLIVGQDPETALAVVPRVFNLCRAAQTVAAQTALGRKTSDADARKEILRDHLLKFHVTWPAFFDMSPLPFPQDWAEHGDDLKRAVFGACMAVPDSADAYWDFLESGQGVAPILSKIADCFEKGEAATPVFEVPDAVQMWFNGPFENSVAGRHCKNPAMGAIADRFGRGPLWRAAARLFDIAMVLDDQLPDVEQAERGSAVVPATRGSYAVKVKVEQGIVTAFERVTPTDHLLRYGGILDMTLENLPADKCGLGPLILDILDPCSPVRLREVYHA